jgi:CheY-like chemotaxis protein
MNSQIPIIALTADVTTADLKKCTDVGMNSYISKPLDEKLLYNKIIALLEKSPQLKETPLPDGISGYTDLTYLKRRTKDDPLLITEMISLYLKQTPPLINQMKKGLDDKDWESVYSAAHKLIPSFSIMGIHPDSEATARKIQEYSKSGEHLAEVQKLVLQLEKVCSGACKELEEELNSINKSI